MPEPSDAPLVQAHVLISGQVQGVSFRWHTQRLAQTLGLTGWVRNLGDGRVEALFEGEKALVDQAVAWCRTGDPPARVDRIEVSYGQPSGDLTGFRIRWP
jgi:acylphosphatase